MTAPVRDIYRRQITRVSGKHRYQELRDSGVTRAMAAFSADISISYAATLDAQSDGKASSFMPTEDHDDRLVAALQAAGGYPRLSERLHRTGHVVCLPLIPYEAGP